ncbi:MAG: NAD(P)/FAD-dependent oxidoreductase [Candidatus Binatia bacterium]
MNIARDRSAPVVIVGAGAAGLMAAIHAAECRAPPASFHEDGATVPVAEASERRRDVIVIESTPGGGRKILISGGGRCNILPGELDESRFVTDSSPNTMKKMLRSWPLAEQRRFFEDDLGIPLRLEPESGKLFPASNRARDVRDGLVALAHERGVSFLFDTTVVALEAVCSGEASPRRGAHHAGDAGAGAGAGGADGPELQQNDADAGASRPDARWRLRTRDGRSIDAHSVVLATGGLSVPKTGSDGTGILIARGLGHEIVDTYAALTPLVCDPPRFGDLAGVSLDVSLTAPTARHPLRSRGGFLFTHRGYSGPAVLDISHLAVRSSERAIVRALPSEATRAASPGSAPKPRQKILVQWTPLDREAWQRELAPRRASLFGVIRAHMPGRLAEALLREAEVPDSRSLAELRSEERRRLLDTLTQYDLPWTGHEGYRTAEVTGGGVALSEVDPRTMESRRCPGLFLCGEILDAFGPIGGYNFLWAWATGRAAGRAAR